MWVPKFDKYLLVSIFFSDGLAIQAKPIKNTFSGEDMRSPYLLARFTFKISVCVCEISEINSVCDKIMLDPDSDLS